MPILSAENWQKVSTFWSGGIIFPRKNGGPSSLLLKNVDCYRSFVNIVCLFMYIYKRSVKYILEIILYFVERKTVDKVQIYLSSCIKMLKLTVSQKHSIF